MFSLFRKPQLIGVLQSTIRNSQNLAAFSSDAPRRVEKTINTVTLLGRVGNDPQVRGSEEHPVVTFSMATHVNYRLDSGDWAQRTDWHQIAIFKPDLRENAKNYLTKGQRVLLSGKISYGEIKDRDGNIRNTTSIIADDLTFFQ